MKRLSKENQAVAKRYDFLRFRCVEEFYDLREDPHALVNRIDDPKYTDIASSMRDRLASWMETSDDYLMEAFQARGDTTRLQAVYAELDAQALQRAETLLWKRYKNRAGGTGKNKLLFRGGKATALTDPQVEE